MNNGKKGSTLSAAFMIAGLSVASDLFAIPISTGLAGFWPAVLISAFVWLYMAASGIMYLEATLACPDGANVVTICRKLIGPVGIFLGVISFLAINLTFMASYFITGVPLISKIFESYFGIYIPNLLILFLLASVCGLIIYLGVYATDRANFVIFTCLLISLIMTIWYGKKHIALHELRRYELFFLPFSIPVLFRAFDYQTVIPTLSTHLRRNQAKLMNAIILGTLLVLACYILWQWFIIGVVPEGSIWLAYESNEAYAQIIKFFTNLPVLKRLSYFLNFFSIASSILVAGIAFVDFLGDAWKIPVRQRKGGIRALLVLAFLLPSLLLSYYYSGFLSRTYESFSGWFEVFFNGILPVWLVWAARYQLHLNTPRLLPGGKWTMILFGFASFMLLYLLGVEIIRKVDVF